MEQVAADIGPELAGDVEAGGCGQIDSDPLADVGSVLLVSRIVEVAECAGGAGAQPERSVGHAATVIGASDCDPREGIAETRAEPSVHLAEVTRVLVQHGREDEGSEEIRTRGAGVKGSIALAEPLGALAPTRVRVFSLLDAGPGGGGYKLEWVDGVDRKERELVADRHGTLVFREAERGREGEELVVLFGFLRRWRGRSRGVLRVNGNGANQAQR